MASQTTRACYTPNYSRFISFVFLSQSDTYPVFFLNQVTDAQVLVAMAMKINCRFGRIEIDPDDILQFPTGLLGLEQCQQWVLLADTKCDALAWLQSLDRPEIALPVTSPRRFVPDYQMRVARRELAILDIEDASAAKILVLVGRTAGGLSLNLKAPVVINPQRRLGRQVITNGEMPVRYELGSHGQWLRRSA